MAEEPVFKKNRPSTRQRGRSVMITGAEGFSILMPMEQAAAASPFFAQRLPAESIDAHFLSAQMLPLVQEFCAGNINDAITPTTKSGAMPAWTDRFQLLEVGTLLELNIAAFRLQAEGLVHLVNHVLINSSQVAGANGDIGDGTRSESFVDSVEVPDGGPGISGRGGSKQGKRKGQAAKPGLPVSFVPPKPVGALAFQAPTKLGNRVSSPSSSFAAPGPPLASSSLARSSVSAPRRLRSTVSSSDFLSSVSHFDDSNESLAGYGIEQESLGSELDASESSSVARVKKDNEYSRLIDTANAPIFGVDDKGNVTVWNRCAAQLSGYSSEETMGRHLVQQFITEDFRVSVKEVFTKALLGEETANFDFPLKTKDGRLLEILLNATSRRDVDGHIIGVVGIGQDITARLAQEQEYSRLIDTANAPIFGVDVEGKVNVWNQHATAVVGFTADETFGQPFVSDFITEDFRASVQEVMDNALQGEETANFQLPLMTKNGTRVEILLNATSRKDAEGRVIGVVGIGQDITARISQEQEYSKLIDTANAPIFGVDVNSNVTIWNKCAANISGYSSADTMGHHLVNEFITEDFRVSVQEVFAKALQGEETANFQLLLMTKNGARVEILLNATTRKDAEGRVIGVVGIGQDITARIAQEQEYSRLIDTANAPIFGVDVHGNVTVWNKCAANISGYTNEDTLGRHLVNEFITEDFRASVQEVLNKALQGQEDSNYAFPLITKDGRRLEILLNATSRRDVDGHIIGVVGIGQDITARLAQEQEYSRLIDTANAPIFGVDVEGKVNVWNQHATTVVGFTADETFGQPFVNDFITEDFRASVQEVMDNALKGEETANFQLPLMTKNGTRVEILLNATSRKDAEGRVIGVVGIGQDITARISQEQEYSKLIDTANAPIFGVDVHGNVTVWNKCAANISGYSSSDTMGHHLVNEFITEDFRVSVQEVFTKALQGEETANFQLLLMTKNGARVEILLNATTRKDAEGQVIGVVGIGQDITARIAQEQEYSRLIDTANAPIFGVDAHGKVTVWNKCAANISGYTSEDTLGRHLVNEFITEDFRASVQEVLNKALQGQEDSNYAFPLITKDGRRLEILLNATSRRDVDGHIIGVVGIGQDITARLAQEQEYSRLIDTANAPIFGVDVNGKVNVWNQHATTVVGFTADETFGQPFVDDFITEDFRASVQEVMDKALQGEETANFQLPLMTKNGARVEILLNATSRKDAEGRVIGVVGIGQDITARIAQEQEYSKLIDTANAPIFGVDVHGNVTVWNNCAAKLSGYTNQDTMGRHLVNKFITEDFRASVQEVLDKALQGLEDSNFAFPLITKDGRRLEILLNATSRRDVDGHIIGVVGIGQDITARIAQEQEYSRLIDTANAPIFGVDEDGRVNVWNFCAAQLSGFSGEDTLGRHLVNEFITEDFRASVKEVLDKALQGLEDSNFAFPLITKDGRRLEILLNATSRRNVDGHIIGVVGIGQDITARLAQEQEYSRLIDTANAPIFGVDMDGRVNVWNQHASKVVGFTAAETFGRPFVDDFITEDFRAWVQEVLDKALRGEETANFQLPLMTKNGTRVEILLNATTRKDAEGRVIGVVGIGQDITARIAQEQEYSRLIDTANAPIFGVDVDGNVTVWNKCAANISGFTNADTMGHHLVNEFITEDFRSSVQEVFAKALQGEETANFQLPLITNQGTRVEILLNATSRKDAEGRVIGVVGIGQDITARIAQEQEYSRVIETANAPIFGVDLNGEVTVWNKCAADVTSFSSAEVMGRHLVQQFISADFRASVQEVLDKALQGEETANFEFPIITKTQTRIQILLNATPRRDEYGHVIGVVGIGQDITARIAQEQEYSRLIDTANAPIFGVDVHGNVTVWNKCAANISGYTSKDTMGRHLVQQFITEDFRALVQEVFDKALQGQEDSNFAFPLITKDGRRLEILLNATSRRDVDGHIIGVVGIGQDISARLAQEQEYSRLIDTANAPIFGVDVDGRVNVWNKCAQALTGYQVKDVLGHKLVDEFVTSNYKQSVQEVLSNAVKGNETANFEFPLIHMDGSHAVQILLNATCRRDDEGRPVGMVGIGQDITDTQARNEAEMRQREAEAAQAAQATISAHVYHEIRNVVGAVLALAERASEAVDLALEDGGESIKNLPDEVRFLTEHQRLVCAHAVNTLNDMLDVSRMENGTYKPKSEVIDLGELCQHAAKLQGPRLKISVQLHLDCPPIGALVVLSDHALLLLQYLTNLLSNAAKFTDKGHVMVTCHSTPHPTDPGWVQVVLGVADTGPGIAPIDQERVLQAFTTGSAVPCEDIGTSVRSTGIGLRLAHLIAQILGDVTPASVAAEQAAALGIKDTAKCKLLEGLIGGLGDQGHAPDQGSDSDRMGSSDSGGSSGKVHHGLGAAMGIDHGALAADHHGIGASMDQGGGHDGRLVRDKGQASAEEPTSQRSIHITSPLPKRLEARLAGGGGPGTYLTIKAYMPIASEERISEAKSESSSNEESGQHTFTLNPIGTLRVLVVDDQRTMRQMVAMLFQKFCQEHPSMRAEVVTALSGEEAVRVASQNHFHIITMDQTLSAGYCKSVKDQQVAAKVAKAKAANANPRAGAAESSGSDEGAATNGRSSEEEEAAEAAAAAALAAARSPAVLVLDHDRLATAKKRTKFFQDEIYNHAVLDGDGEMDGHMAMQGVLESYGQSGRTDKPVMFNLTGNVMDADQEKYMAAGSSGVLAKPTKLSDMTSKIQASLQSFLELGIAVTDCRGFVTTPDGRFCYTRITPSCADPDEELPSFTPSEEYGPSVASSLEALINSGPSSSSSVPAVPGGNGAGKHDAALAGQGTYKGGGGAMIDEE